MRDFNTTELRRQAAESARKGQRQLRLSLVVVHIFVYIAAIVVLAALVMTLPGLASAIWTSIDLSLVIFGLFMGWGIGIALHGATLLVDSDWMERRMRRQAASGLLGRALLEYEEDELPAEAAKAKHRLDDLADYVLDDDGELTSVEGEDHKSHHSAY
ncbi:MAG TPA: hypothetical protein VER79_02145 [Candidatus Limnocylindrales bacterium]|nr:hypothetical protein [Candidatus Limnocylindrales bacterium]